MLQREDSSSFTEQMRRILFVSGKRTQVELAEFLGIQQSSISDAKRRKNIPPGWLLVLMRIKQVNPEWILTGNGPCFIHPPSGDYETGEDAMQHAADYEMLRRIPSWKLTDELLRRIATAKQ